MSAAAATPLQSRDGVSSSGSSSVQHQYGTRTRSNSVIRPSARLRQSPDLPPPRRIKPALAIKPKPMPHDSPQSDMPVFPPPHVTLHAEDANSKVLLAIGRAFFSVDNRAMTIKDLSEMTLRYGLNCQNASAAGQAITTYIRAHTQRCDETNDAHLIRRVTMSGTAADDELAPALHSRGGGAHSPPDPTRTTNFRKGTVVWYLTKATGAPCPFERAGIKLDEYGKNGRKNSPSEDARERRRERDRARRAVQCGQKRKRSLRSSAKTASETESDQEERRPPKVKLTLRLRPSLAVSGSTLTPAVSPPKSQSPDSNIIDLSGGAESDDQSMDVDSSVEDTSSEESEDLDDEEMDDDEDDEDDDSTGSVSLYSAHSPSAPQDSLPTPGMDGRRSPSLAYSLASPPPDSEVEDEDFHISMAGVRRSASRFLWGPLDDDEDDFDWDFNLDDTESLGESSGPRSPSAQPTPWQEDTVAVKREALDSIDLYDDWSDPAKAVEVITKAVEPQIDIGFNAVKTEEVDEWDFEAALKPPLEYDLMEPIKEEEQEFGSIPASSSTGQDDINCTSPLTPLSALFPRPSDWSQFPRPRELAWDDVELLGPDSVHPEEFEHGVWPESDKGKEKADLTVRARHPPLPTSPTQLPSSDAARSRAPTAEPLSTPELEQDYDRSSIPLDSPSLASSVQTVSSPDPLRSPIMPGSPLTDIDSPEDDRPDPFEELRHLDGNIGVVHTCQPLTPPISVTVLEGIVVYQMAFGATRLLRRADTNFVNLTSILDYLGYPAPDPSTILGCEILSRGSAVVCGIWVPLAVAQEHVQHYHLPDSLEIFLSDTLRQQFPQVLDEFCASRTSAQSLTQAGVFGLHFASTLEEKKIAIPPPFEAPFVLDPPLSPAEQEMFHSLCFVPEWEKENSAVHATPRKGRPRKQVVEVQMDVDDEVPSSPTKEPATERQLRRSKRVAAAARSRTRSSS